MFDFDDDKQMIYLLLQEIYLISNIEIFECLTHKYRIDNLWRLNLLTRWRFKENNVSKHTE